MKFIDEEVIKRLHIDYNLSSNLENLLTNGFYGIGRYQYIIIVYQASNGLDVICANFDMDNDHEMCSYFKDIDTANKKLQSYKDIIDRKLEGK
jgi:ankyrin repeat protein